MAQVEKKFNNITMLPTHQLYQPHDHLYSQIYLIANLATSQVLKTPALKRHYHDTNKKFF
jgi:hypothetical protein